MGYELGEFGPADTEPEPPVPSLVEFGQQYVRDLSGITPATRHRDDRQVLRLAQQLRAVLRTEPTIANIGEVHVRRWVNAREAAGARPKTIASYHGLLYMILAAAVRVGLRAGNPCAGTWLPDRYLPDADGDNQFALIAAAVAWHAGTVEDRMLIEVPVGTGLRW